MKHYIKYSKLPFVYSVINAANKSHALRQVADWRNDAVVFADEKVFSFAEAIEFQTKWTLREPQDICNTEITFRLTDADKKVVHVKCRPCEFEKKMRETFNKNGFLITIGNKECFAVKVKTQAQPLFYVQRNVKHDEVPALKD